MSEKINKRVFFSQNKKKMNYKKQINNNKNHVN